MQKLTELTEGEWALLRQRFTDYLNSFPGDDLLADDYFTGHLVLADHRALLDRYLLVEAITDDDGGSSVLFLHLNDPEDIGAIEFACHTFDTTTVVWINNGKEVKA